MALFHCLLEISALLLELCHSFVPQSVELLKLEHMGFFHTKPLRNLSAAHGFSSSVFLMLAQLIQAVFGNFSFYILSLTLAVLSVFFQNLPEPSRNRHTPSNVLIVRGQ